MNSEAPLCFPLAGWGEVGRAQVGTGCGALGTGSSAPTHSEPWHLASGWGTSILGLVRTERDRVRFFFFFLSELSGPLFFHLLSLQVHSASKKKSTQKSIEWIFLLTDPLHPFSSLSLAASNRREGENPKNLRRQPPSERLQDQSHKGQTLP